MANPTETTYTRLRQNLASVLDQVANSGRLSSFVAGEREALPFFQPMNSRV
jgi:hypothetical protein